MIFEYFMGMLSKRQKQLFDFINRFIETHDYAPSLEEIAHHFKLSAVSTVHYHVNQLVQKGLLTKRWNANRSIRIMRDKPDTMLKLGGDYGSPPNNPHQVVSWTSPRINVVVPLLGVIAAGRPIEATEQNETIELPPSLIGRKDTYVLRVQGDSMIEEHIRDGDYVVVEKRETADNGETVVALLNGSEATLKKFYREEKGQIRLQPANPAMAPIYCREEECVIQGVVVAILRKFS